MDKWLKKFKTKGVEIKKIGNRYYAYKVRSVWNKKLKRAKKISGEYLGAVTPEGIVKPRTNPVPKGIYEYGNVSLLYSLCPHLINLLKKHYPYQWEQIISFSLLRLIQPLPLKSVKSLHEKTYLSVLFPSLHLSPKALSNLIKGLGENYIPRLKIMHALTEKGGYALFDISAIISRSKNNHWLEYGYNKNHVRIPQINIGVFYSLKSNLPTYIKIFPGSLRDVKSLVNAVDESGIRDVVLVLDRGFHSDSNITHLKKRNIQFIMPLRKNIKIANYRVRKWKGFIIYRKRHIKHYSYISGDHRVHIFEDAKLRYEEERGFYSLVELGKKDIRELKKKEEQFGKVAILTNNKELSSEDVYLMFKRKEYVEYCFNVLKNLLDADRGYLRSRDMLDGYMFLNFLSLYVYFLLLNKNKEKKLIKRYSVKDILLELSKVYVVRYEKKEIISELSKRARDIINIIGTDLFPKLGGS